MTEPENVTLTLKNPSASSPGDVNVTVSIDCTVSHLKDTIQREYPGHPEPARQKLIVSGQLIRDSAVIRDVFKQKFSQKDWTVPQVMHLVIASSGPLALDNSASNSSWSSRNLGYASAAGPTMPTEPNPNLSQQTQPAVPPPSTVAATTQEAGSRTVSESLSVEQEDPVAHRDSRDLPNTNADGTSTETNVPTLPNTASNNNGVHFNPFAYNPSAATLNPALLAYHASLLNPAAFGVQYPSAGFMDPLATLPLPLPPQEGGSAPPFFPPHYPPFMYPFNYPLYYPPPMPGSGLGFGPEEGSGDSGSREESTSMPTAGPQDSVPPSPPHPQSHVGPPAPVDPNGGGVYALPQAAAVAFGAPNNGVGMPPVNTAPLGPHTPTNQQQQLLQYLLQQQLAFGGGGGGGFLPMMMPPPMLLHPGIPQQHEQQQRQRQQLLQAMQAHANHAAPAVRPPGIPVVAVGAMGPQAVFVQRAGAGNNEILRVPAGRRIRVQLRLDLMLIMKLAVVVFVFNQEGSIQRFVVLFCMAVLIYLYQTGALTPFLRWAYQRGHWIWGSNGANQPQSTPNADLGGQANRALRVEHQRVNEGNPSTAHITRRQNRAWTLIREVRLFIWGFVSSLLPGFQGPDGEQPQVHPIPLNEDAGRPHQE